MAGLQAEHTLCHVHAYAAGLLEHVLPGEAGPALACEEQGLQSGTACLCCRAWRSVEASTLVGSPFRKHTLAVGLAAR